jgi:hypothetical protein
MDASGDIGNSEQTGQGVQPTQSELIEYVIQERKFWRKNEEKWQMFLRGGR